ARVVAVRDVQEVAVELVLDDAVVALLRVGPVAAEGRALVVAVDRLDGLAEAAGAVRLEEAGVRGLDVRAVLVHPVPDARLPRDGAARVQHVLGVVQQVHADVIAGGLVVVVPRELDRAAAEVRARRARGNRGRAAVRGRAGNAVGGAVLGAA